MSRFLSSKFAKLDAYVPGEQPKSRSYIKLNTNESPYPPSPGVYEALAKADAERLRLYCDPTSQELRCAIAGYHGYEKENVFVASGSDDILNFAFEAWGEEAVFPDITYGFYRVFAKRHRLSYKEIPLNGDLSPDISKLNIPCTLLVIANPNAPTGLCVPLSDIRRLVEYDKNRMVLVDEAYVDFGGESAMELVLEYGNLLVVRTYSKSRSLAGLRLGYAVGNAELIKDLELLKDSTNPYNVSTLCQLLGRASLKDEEYFRSCVSRVILSREKIKSALRAYGYTVTDSKANFVFVKSQNIKGSRLYTLLRDRGILVRHFNVSPIEDYLRITVGSEEETEILIKTLGEIENENK